MEWVNIGQPKVSTIDNGYMKPPTYQVFVMVNSLCFWLTKYGYVPAIESNVKFYSTFKKLENAEKAASKPVKFYAK